MRIIALMNQKGGVGKTTTTVNLGAALAEAGKSVCLIDMDPQAHLTLTYGIEPSPDQPSLYTMLVENGSFLETVRVLGKRLAVVPGSINLAAAEIELVNVPGRETLLKRRLEAAQHDFDFVLLDCPPGLGLMTLNALAAAGEVIIPMQPHFLAMHGVGKLVETVEMVNHQINPALKIAGIVFTMFDSQARHSGEVADEVQRYFETLKSRPGPCAETVLFKTRIRRNIKLAESPSFGQTILQYDPTSNGAQDYRALAREVINLGKVKAASTTPATPAPVVSDAPSPAAPASEASPSAGSPATPETPAA
jgi:chromosome partitioning protein